MTTPIKTPLIFNSWGAMLAKAATLDQSASPMSSDPKWAGAANVGEACQIATYGWGAGMARVRAVALPAVETITSALAHCTEWVFDVTGADYDVGEYLSGVPECWLSPEPTSARPCVRLLVNVAASGGITGEAIEMRGAAVVALALGLQGAGYAVQVDACLVVDHHGEAIASLRVPLTDDQGGPLDADRLLFALAHPSMLRQIGAALIANDTGKPGSWVGSSMPADPPESMGWIKGADLYLPKMLSYDANFSDAASIARWVADVYASITEGKGRAAQG